MKVMAQEEYDFQIIANLMAGKGEAGKELERIKNFLENNGQSYRVTAIDTPTPISKIPEDGRIKIKKGVICIGGDGTVSETVGYVLNNKIKVPIALIPTGTANIIAATLGLELKKDSFDFLLKNKLIEVDIGVAEYQNEKDYFLLGLGLGFEENFLRLTKEKFKSKIGIFSYIFAAASELLSLKKIPLVIENPEIQIKTEVCLLTVLNLQPVILAHFPLFKNKEIKGDDGVLNIYFVEYNGSIFGKSFFQAFLGTLFFHILGKKNFGLVKEISGKEFSLESPALVPTQIDGELRGNLPVRINLNPQKCIFLTS